MSLEFMNWGPIGADGCPLKSKRGETFKAFVNSLVSLGYRVDYRVLNAANYGAPTTRKRFILQAVRGKNKIAWPAESHTKDADMFATERWVPARDIIDWDIHGKSIFNRKKPLADNTIRRIETGIKKYWGEWAEPFLLIMKGASNVQNINKPIPALTTKQYVGLIEPFILHQMSGMNGIPIDKPLPTVTTRCGHALIEPFLLKYYGSGANAEIIGEPLDTITTKDRFALVEGSRYSLDIRFRMLKPHELAAATSFPKDYVFSGTGADKVKQIGNAVPPKLAEALINAALKVA